ncbi:late secretory pathway protein AVL9 homolog isoform X1 [Hydra vulgaris]|uniref:Late secretory pathway protein AVL9 homolog n=1 Tax=Hydra vulgaris TaxID=6087 RepID=T2M9S2_HYDVU|nr:late secretory pathway protein AVL9 homolog [Hydra vulgaris]
MSQGDNDAVIAHILVVGFHHQKGTQIEFCYPMINDPLLDNKDGSEINLPKAWQALPYLAMPDGAHNFEDDCSFFNLPALTKGSKLSTETVFGVSCFRQIDSKKLKNKDENITRTSVQKSVCILMKMPLYTFILSKLELVTHAYFNELDFSQTQILKDCFDNLCKQIPSVKLDDSIYMMGLTLQDVVMNFRQKLLVLLKLLLLEKKIVFWGTPVKSVCKFVLSIVTLFPGLLQKGLTHACCAENIYIKKGTQTPHDIYGLPLGLFEEGVLFHPYISLHNMTLLRKPKVHSFVIGCSNVLFKQQMHCPWDVLVDLETFTLHIGDENLENSLNLSTEDLRFCEYLINVVESSIQTMGWEGSDDWIRLQFKAYLLCLMSTVESSIGDGGVSELHSFNGAFCEAWLCTNNFKKWHNSEHPGMEHFHKGHPFQGDITVSDLQRRFNHFAETFASEETRKKIAQAILKTQNAVGGALISAKNAFSTAKDWMNSMMHEIETEVRKHSESRTVSTTQIDWTTSKMVITDRDRRGESVTTIGDLIERKDSSHECDTDNESKI